MHADDGEAVESKDSVALEADDGPALLRFLVKPGNFPQALRGDKDPSDPKLRAERSLLQAAESRKRRRYEQPAEDPEAAEERSRALRELQQSALSGLRRAERVAELLLRTDWGLDGRERARFLQLQSAAWTSPGRNDTVEPPALNEDWPNRFREAGRVLAASRRHAELEDTLRYLRRHWLIHSLGGRYAVELWRDQRAGQSRAGTAHKLTGRYLAYIGRHPQLGVCVNFPQEYGQLVQGRHRLSVRIRQCSQRSEAQNDHPCLARERAAFPTNLVEPGAPREEAVHAVLLEAQLSLVELDIFRSIHESLSRKSRMCRWHVLRASVSEISFLVLMADETGNAGAEQSFSSSGVGEGQATNRRQEAVGLRLMGVTILYGPTQDSVSYGAEARADVLDWVSELAHVRLRELHLEGLRAADTGAGGSETCASSPDLLGAFQPWLEAHLRMAADYSVASSDLSDP